MCLYVCWHNRKALAHSGLACVCVYVCERELWAQGSRDFGGGPQEGASPGVPLPSCNDSPGHVTTGSHRGTGQSETRGQRVRAACLFHCLCGVPRC